MDTQCSMLLLLIFTVAHALMVLAEHRSVLSLFTGKLLQAWLLLVFVSQSQFVPRSLEGTI